MQTAYDIESRLLEVDNLTLITVTHNLKAELLNKYDEIIYMENGSIKENGSFEELINTGSHFSEYFRLRE